VIKIKKKWILFFAIAIFILVFSLLPLFPDMTGMDATEKMSLADMLGSMFWVVYIIMMGIYAVTTFVSFKNKE